MASKNLHNKYGNKIIVHRPVMMILINTRPDWYHYHPWWSFLLGPGFTPPSVHPYKIALVTLWSTQWAPERPNCLSLIIIGVLPLSIPIRLYQLPFICTLIALFALLRINIIIYIFPAILICDITSVICFEAFNKAISCTFYFLRVMYPLPIDW